MHYSPSSVKGMREKEGEYREDFSLLLSLLLTALLVCVLACFAGNTQSENNPTRHR